MSLQDRKFTTVLSLAQTLLTQAQESEAITTELIAAKVALAMQVSVVSPVDVDPDEVMAELIRRFSLWIGEDITLSSSEGHVQWLHSGRKSGWRYWVRYQSLLEKRISPAAVDGLDRSTDRILGLLEDPKREGPWDRRGLVVGHVQSGKTGNYSGLICKAADAGYKVIIVLAGLHNNLRAQTQIRLEEAFLGFETTGNNGPLVPIGVGLEDSDPTIVPNCATTRMENGDFNERVARHVAITPEQRPWLFVVKKNKSVLENLLSWIRDRVADSRDAATDLRFVSTLPLLVIDDEADNASVDTGAQAFDEDGNPDPEHEPKAINRRIRRILHAFAKSAYVGYTATPFANIFIHRRAETPTEGPDLFPEAFIINLAAPSIYVGPARLFGVREADGSRDPLPLIRRLPKRRDTPGDDDVHTWMPVRHRKEHQPLMAGLPALPATLQEAILAFVLACVTRKVRGQEREHSSMLVHVTRFVMVQQAVTSQVEEFVSRLRQALQRQIGHEAVLASLQALWERDFEPTTAAVLQRVDASEAPALRRHAWHEIEPEIAGVVEDLQVRMVNGSAGDVLDYATPTTRGLRVIAIGGDKLARGLTLEGLCTSYFLRASRMYDTLMQMGRWFGYRPGYIDLCRLYTSEELVEWFGHIADAAEELREEFEHMADVRSTPREYGLKVQSHSVLMVTSPLKMRSAHNLQISFSGDVLETVALYRDPAVLSRNLAALNEMLVTMGPPHEVDPVRDRPGGQQAWVDTQLWTRVQAQAVVRFLRAYVTHPNARKVNSILITEFIEAMSVHGELTDWTVVLLGNGDGNAAEFSGGIRVRNMIKRKVDTIDNRYSLGRLISPRDEAIDLDSDAWQAALDQSTAQWRLAIPNGSRQRREEPPIVPGGPAIRRVRGDGTSKMPPARDRGLLLIYPIDPTSDGMTGGETPVIGFGISFPASDRGIKVTYQVDHKLWEEQYGNGE